MLTKARALLAAPTNTTRLGKARPSPCIGTPPHLL